MRNKVFCLGELLVDFFCTTLGEDLINGKQFEKQAGGAPANVCATIAKLGGNAYFCGKVGDDSFGTFLEQTLSNAGVHTTMLVKDAKHPTTLAFVSRQMNGERDFIFSRGADEHLQVCDIQASLLSDVKIGHFGSATALLSDPFKTTYIQYMYSLKAQGCFITFDPNYREGLWKGEDEAFIEVAKRCISLANFVKVSEEEAFFITNTTTIEDAAEAIHLLGAEAVAITLGERGTFISAQNNTEIVSSIAVKPVDTTGAGDAFLGAVVYQLAQLENPHTCSFTQYKEFVRFGNITGALVCENVGAIEAIPTLEKINQLV